MAFKRSGRMGPRDFTDSVSLRDVRTLTVSPASPTKTVAATQQFTVAATNQFGEAVPAAAGEYTWTVASGAISSAGLASAGTAGGPYLVRATHTATGVTGDANLTITA